MHTLVCNVKRNDRVYAVALDEKGDYMVVGGRDKKLAMYDVDRGEGRPSPYSPVEAVLLWEVSSEDFIYCVTLSRDMQFVAYGGTAKKAVLLSARSGTVLFELSQPGVIWSVAMHDSQMGWQLAVGGELPVISVVRVEQQVEVLQLPVSGTCLPSLRMDVLLAATFQVRSVTFVGPSSDSSPRVCCLPSRRDYL